jgi:hypothetical protein
MEHVTLVTDLEFGFMLPFYLFLDNDFVICGVPKISRYFNVA